MKSAAKKHHQQRWVTYKECNKHPSQPIGWWFCYDAGAGATRVFLASTGRVGIGNDVTSPNAGLVVTNADIRCTAAAVANDANSISMSQESANNSYIVSRGNSTSERGNIYLVVSRSNGGGGIAGLVVNNDGSVSKNSGSFKIDHPLESKKDTHHLVHSFVEAPQADNIYRGVVQLKNGEINEISPLRITKTAV